MLRLALILSLGIAVPLRGMADDQCADPMISVEAPDDLAARTCAAAVTARKVLAACNVPLGREVRVRVTRDLLPDCMGLYHCGTELIEVLHPDLIAVRTRPESPFAALDTDSYFASIITHEMTHAAYDSVRCPFGDCLVTSEYLAYAMQIAALAPDLRAPFTDLARAEGHVTAESLSRMTLLMAPGTFALRSWAHFSTRPDPCGYAGQIMSGTLLLDRELPH
ncbi:MAG: DUF6639 family protein [Pseudooceanicola sp.]